MSGNDSNDGQGGVAAPSFPITVTIVALIAAVAVALVNGLSLPAWMLYMGWISFAVAGGKPRPAAAMLACVLLGLALGMAGALAMQATTPSLGGLALPAMVFGVTAIAVAAQKFPVVSYVVGYFIGMTGFFASGLAPGVPAFLTLAAAAASGTAAGWLATVLPGALAAKRGRAAT